MIQFYRFAWFCYEQRRELSHIIYLTGLLFMSAGTIWAGSHLYIPAVSALGGTCFGIFLMMFLDELLSLQRVYAENYKDNVNGD